MEKFEFYGAPDIEQEMTEGLMLRKTVAPKGKLSRAQRVEKERSWRKQLSRSRKKLGLKPGERAADVKLEPGEKMVFGKVVKVESATANLRAELEMAEGLFGPKKTPAQQLQKRLKKMKAKRQKSPVYGAMKRYAAGEFGKVKKKPSLGQKLKAGMKMVFGKLRKVEDIENELAALEATPSPFLEVREQRIQELREEVRPVIGVREVAGQEEWRILAAGREDGLRQEGEGRVRIWG